MKCVQREVSDFGAHHLNSGGLVIKGSCQVCDGLLMQECVAVQDVTGSCWWPVNNESFPVLRGKPICEECMANVTQAMSYIES